MSAALQGIYASTITPRRLGVQDINLGAMWELIDFLCARHVQGLVLLGSTGEFVHFSPSERMRMMGLAPRRSRVPVIINVSHSTLDGSVELAQAASSSGAAAVLLTAPSFYRYDEDTVRTFFVRFVEDADIPIPILLYRLPQCTNGCSFDLFRDLTRQGLIHGIADSSADPAFLEALLHLRAEVPFTLMVGEDLFAVKAGVDGAVSAAACVVPELMAASCKQERVRPRIAELVSWMDRLPVPVGVKEALAVRGLKPGPHAVPLSAAQEEIAGEFRAWFRAWLPATLKECEHA
jgi:4-hydroxy-tetrahydrodipicolinate synthase